MGKGEPLKIETLEGFGKHVQKLVKSFRKSSGDETKSPRGQASSLELLANFDKELRAIRRKMKSSN